MTMKVIVDPIRCQGHGRCYAIAPEVFEPNDDYGHAEVTHAEVAPENFGRVRRALDDCPEFAIDVVES